jgi:tetratricopeptide (TPR) repeat protein
MTDDSELLFRQAVGRHREGDFAEAISLFEQIIERTPGNLDARYLLGTAFLQQSRFEESIVVLKMVISERPDVADTHNNLGVAYKAIGDWEDAVRSFEAALKINPEYSEAYFNLGSLMEQRELFADAEKCYRHSLRIESTDVTTRNALANVLKAQAKWPEAEMAYRECQRNGLDTPELNINLAYVLAKLERPEEAATLYHQILEQQPDFAEIHNSLSYVEERRGRLTESLAAARRAVELKPDYAEGHNNRGIALRSLHRLEESLPAFLKAVNLKPNFALAEFNLGTTHLLAGDYPQGWPGYESREEALGETPRTFPQPKWNGNEIAGQRLFVFADQGFGDTIQFSRFLSEAKPCSQASVIFECQPQLVETFRNCPSVDRCIAEGNDLPEFDAWISLASLPGLFDVTLETVADFSSELEFNSTPRAELQSLIKSPTEKTRTVGLVWRGNPEQARDHVRSCPPEFLEPILGIEKLRFLSLQTGIEKSKDDDWLKRQVKKGLVTDLGSELRDFTDTSAVISQLDLVITVDTATAHLAGTLGANVWAMLCHTPDWRWGLHGSNLPWYPSMQLFRQPAWGDWGSVITNIVKSLQNF